MSKIKREKEVLIRVTENCTTQENIDTLEFIINRLSSKQREELNSYFSKIVRFELKEAIGYVD